MGLIMKPEIQNQKMNTAPIPICIPLHRLGGKFRDNTELRFALRSIERHFRDPYRIVIVSQVKVPWLQGVEYVHGQGLKSSLKAAADHCPDGFFWWYDDCCLLRDTGAEELKTTPACRGWSKANTGWARSLEKIRQRLEREGFKAWDYSRPHGPYWFDLSMVDEGFHDWHGMKSKFPWESWILSKRDWPRRHGAVKQYYGPFRNPPSPGAAIMNYNDSGTTPELVAWLASRFDTASRHESPEDAGAEQVVHSITRQQREAVYLMDAWKAHGSTPLRTICECAVGGYTLLEGFRTFAEKCLLIEPDPKMARQARVRYPWARVREVAVGSKEGRANLRRLNGSSYIKGIAWAPAFDSCPDAARKAGKVAVAVVPFSSLDDGRIDLINIDCEGSEWQVLQGMHSRPVIIQIEMHAKNPDCEKMEQWFQENHYTVTSRWGIANRIYFKES